MGFVSEVSQLVDDALSSAVEFGADIAGGAKSLCKLARANTTKKKCLVAIEEYLKMKGWDDWHEGDQKLSRLSNLYEDCSAEEQKQILNELAKQRKQVENKICNLEDDIKNKKGQHFCLFSDKRTKADKLANEKKHLERFSKVDNALHNTKKLKLN